MAVEVADLVAYLGLDDQPFYRGMDSAERRMDTGASRMRASMATIGQAAMSVGFGIGRALVGGLEAVVRPAADFEHTLSGIRAVSGASAAQMQRFHDLALQLGKDTTFSASDAAAGIEELIKGGVSIQDVMSGAARATLNLAAAGGIDLTSAAEIAANALNMFSLSGGQMGHVADEIAGAANASSLSVQDFRYSLAYAGTTAKNLNISFDDLAVAIAELGQAGIKGSSAGTGLRAVMTALASPTKAAAQEMYRLGIITAQGTNRLFDAQGHMKRLADVQEILKTSLGGLTDQQQTAALSLIFGRQAAQVAAIMAEDGAKKFGQMAAAMGKVTAASVAAERLKDLIGDITNLTGSVETFTVTVGEAFGGGQGMPIFRRIVQDIKGVVDTMTDWTTAHGPLLARLGPLAAAIGGVSAGTLALGGAFTVVLATMGPLTIALGGLLTAGAGVAAAWSQNWGGIQQSVQRAWAGMQPALAALGGAAGGTFAAFQRGGAGAAWAVGFAQFQSLFSRFTGWMAGEALPALRGQLGRWAGAFEDWVLPAIPVALGYLGMLKDRMVAWISEQVPVWTAQLGRWGTAISAWARQEAPIFARQLGLWGRELWLWVSPRIPQVLSALGQLKDQAVAWITGQAPAIRAAVGHWRDAFVGWATGAWAAAQPALRTLGNQVIDWIDARTAQIKENTKKWADAFAAWLVPAQGKTTSGMNAWVDAVTKWVNSRGVQAMSRLGGALATALVTAMGEALKRKAAGMAGDFLYGFTPAGFARNWGEILGNNSAVDAAKFGFGVGNDLAQGLQDGIATKLGQPTKAEQAMRDHMKALQDAARAAADAHSPSRVYMRLGQDMMAGLALGISGQQGALAATMAQALALPRLTVPAAVLPASGWLSRLEFPAPVLPSVPAPRAAGLSRPFGGTPPAVAGIPASATGGSGAGAPIFYITIHGDQAVTSGGSTAEQRSKVQDFGRAVVGLAEQFELATRRSGAGAPASVAGGR